MLFTRKQKKKEWNIDESYLELIDGQEAVAIGTTERSVISGSVPEIMDCILGLLDNLESCTDTETILGILDMYMDVKRGKRGMEDTPAPKKRGRKPKNKEVK